ncbi:hypothetical protein MVEN_00684400 [Mycena venus]|uniref:Uncharacterized protein n=1 Tax=Mycena venus TaxID=2733690 RepID=A0A8H7D5F6_9AGAR|nr:hypothetical protein MVEN_00684400 [Mycena venus]
MSSRPSTPIDSDDDMLTAMTQETPTASRTITASKRNHAAMVGDDDTTSDNEHGAGATLPLTVALPNQNIVAAARHYAQKKRIRGDQLIELEAFLKVGLLDSLTISNLTIYSSVKDPASLREAKLFTNLFTIGNQLEKINASKPAYEVSDDLEMNIQKYAPAILLSSKINVYKGEATTNYLLELLKIYRFDIPVGLENIPTDWAKVVASAEYALTQRRSKIKKVIRSSLKPREGEDKKIVYAPPNEHQTIFQLTTAVVKGTQCSVNVMLASRIALMLQRKTYLKYPGLNFWDQLDLRLEKIRNDANGDAKKIVRAFRHILEKDQNEHGVKNDNDKDLEDTVDAFQKKVDDILDIDVIDASTSAQGV